MKIISWNCNGAFRKKYHLVVQLDPDIMVIQECENPDKFITDNGRYGYRWVGSNPNKGLGVFFKKKHHIQDLEWNDQWRGRSLQWFLPTLINQKTTLLGVWTHKADAKAFAYIGQFYLYMQNNKNKFKNTDIVCGDFNSNAIWHAWDIWWNHIDCVDELRDHNLHSIYHTLNGLAEGHENAPTLLHRKNLDNGYHIDYIYTDKDRISRTKEFELGEFSDWMNYSDHVPLIWEYDESGD